MYSPNLFILSTHFASPAKEYVTQKWNSEHNKCDENRKNENKTQTRDETAHEDVMLIIINGMNETNE